MIPVIYYVLDRSFLEITELRNYTVVAAATALGEPLESLGPDVLVCLSVVVVGGVPYAVTKPRIHHIWYYW